ncbi:MAG: alpha/beta hydrolase [Actinobacteria bacterium]|nr:alpha/beta hydrolase [Actinomycetota bacterium]
MGDLVGSKRASHRPLLALRQTSIGVIAAAMLCVPASANAAEPRTLTVGALTLTACDSVEVEGSQAWCGTLPRPWDPALPESGTLNVGFVLTLPTGAARAAAAAPRSSETSAIVALEGGPGWGGISSGTDFAEPFGDQLQTRGMLVMDQRGTGLSAPVDCDEELDTGETWRESIGLCAAKLGDRFDLFGTALAADDLAAVINALQLGPSNIYGVSYGTFFGQVFACRHPELTRTLLLDSAYPVFGEEGWVETIGPSLTDALNRSCRRAPSCAKFRGSSSSRLSRVLKMLRTSPVRVTAPAPDGSMSKVSITPSDLAQTIIDAGYGGTTYSGVDAALRAALAGDWLPLGRLINESQGSGSRPLGDGSTEANDGLMYAVICQDYPQIVDMSSQPAARDDQQRAAVAAGRIAKARLYAPFTVDEFMATDWWDQDSCMDWPVSARYPSKPPTPPSGGYGNQPTLVLSGDLDLVTTVREGAMVAAQFPNSRQIVVASGTHGLTGNECVDGLVQEFIAEPQPVVDGAGGECAANEPPVRLVSGYPRTSQGVTTDVAAARTVTDLLDRWRNGPDSRTIKGHGLRGGTWKAVGYDTVQFTLNQVKLYEDLPVSGTVRWDDEGNVTASLKARGRTIALKWSDWTHPTLSTQERVG